MKKRVLIIIAVILIAIFASAFLFKTSSKEYVDTRPDADKDKIPDVEDAFPNDIAASIDSDGDGYPDRWNEGKSQKDSTSIPPLFLDDFPYDASEWKDSDGDRVGDNSDVFPNNPNEWSDLDADGVGDNSDINPKVDLAIGFKITKFKITKRVDILRWAQIYFIIKINNQEPIKITNNGKNWFALLNNVKEIIHDKITYDIDDATSERYTNIEVTMYDADFLFGDDIVDITKEADSSKLLLKFDNVENKLNNQGISEGSKATIWYELTTNTEKEPNINFYTRTYNWHFENKKWETSLQIPTDTYKKYLDLKVNRMPQNQPSSTYAMAAFVTSNDRIIIDLSLKLKSLANDAKYDSVKAANFILRFVQENVKYSLDNESKGCIEYWRFPIETLVDLEGDCEDTSVLYASIMDALDYDVVLLYYMWEDSGQKLGHIAVGVHLEGDQGDYVLDENGKKYFYCETTTITYFVGKIPPDLEEDPKKIVHI